MELVDYLNGISPLPTFTAGVAPNGDDIVAIAAAATSATLYELLNNVSDGSVTVTRVYPIRAPEKTAAPYIVYSLDSARLQTVGVGQMGTIVEFDVGIFHTTAALLSATIDSVNSTLTGVSITGISTGIDSVTNLMVAVLRVEVLKPAISGAYPLALVSHTGESAGDNIYDNRVAHQVRRDFSIALVSSSDNIETLRAELRGYLLGWQQTSSHEAMMYAGGRPIEIGGGIYCWQEDYYDFIHYREA